MEEFKIVDKRADREITKKLVKKGDYNLVPYEDSRCKIVLSNITCIAESGDSSVDPASRIFSKEFDGKVLIGDSDNFIDKDIELVLQQMCSGEVSDVKIVYKDNSGKVAQEISCRIDLKEITEEQLISDWSWQRLHEAAQHHKDRGVELVKEKRIVDAFRRFSKGFKMLVAVEPIDPEVIPEEAVKEMIDLKVKLYNNLAHCQLHFNEYEAALDLCSKAIKYDPVNSKALYRRCLAYSGLKMYEEAWNDIQAVLHSTPNDKLAQQKANVLKPIIEKINDNYKNVVKKMFTS